MNSRKPTDNLIKKNKKTQATPKIAGRQPFSYHWKIKKKSSKAIPSDVLSYQLFKFFSNYDLAKISTTSKEWSTIARQTRICKKASHVVKEFITDHKLPFQKIRVVGDVMDSNMSLKTSERIQIEIFKEKNSDEPSKKTTVTLLDIVKFRKDGGSLFDLGKNEFGIANVNFSRGGCYVSMHNSKSYFFTRNMKLKISQNSEAEASFLLSDFEKRFIEALFSNNKEDALALVKYIKNPNIFDGKGYPILARAASLGYLQVVEQLVTKKADLELITTYNNGSSTPLLEAAFSCQLDVIRYLVEQGANVNAQTNSGNTILHMLYDRAEEGLITNQELYKISQFLLDKKANPCIVNLNDNRPADLNFRLMYVSTMDKDAEKRIEKKWSFDSEKGTYNIEFKKNISHRDKIWAWEAVVHKIKSLPVNGTLGLADDESESNFFDRTQFADSIIPNRQDYAIKSFMGDEKLTSITIQIKPEYISNLKVRKAIEDCLTTGLFKKEKVKQQAQRSPSDPQEESTERPRLCM